MRIASLATRTGWRWRKTLPKTRCRRVRGESAKSCRKMDFQTFVFFTYCFRETGVSAIVIQLRISDCGFRVTGLSRPQSAFRNPKFSWSRVLMRQEKVVLLAQPGPIFQPPLINEELPIVRHVHGAAPQGLGSRPGNDIPVAVEVRAVARALEPALRLKPIGRAAQVRAPRPETVEAFRLPDDPHSLGLLPLLAHADRVVLRLAGLKGQGRFIEHLRKQVPEAREEPAS